MTQSELLLAPVPKRLNYKPGVFDSTGKRYIRLEAEEPQLLLAAAKKVGLDWQITASPKTPKDKTGLVIRLDEASGIMAEGYKLTIKPDVIEITASIPAGAFYGACTLAQIIRQCGGEIPCLSVTDWPDFPERGVMLDISRDKVPTMETLYHLVDLLAEWKINQFQLYTEHTFAYPSHEVVWENASPMTGGQIMQLDAYCKSRFIELVPNQNSFGHMERWLKHEKYNSMAEAPNGCDTVWGFREAFSLAPVDKRSIPFVAGLYDELLPHFTSSLFNVGADETIDLGCVRSKKVCEERGTGRVYLDFLLDIYKLVKERDRIMMFWGDIIIHHPELISELPEDVVALEWGYEAEHPFKENTARFAAAGIPFYVCPGTSSWNTLAGRTDNAIANIMNAATNGLKQGAIGLLNTDWGDRGHWQPLSVSYLGFMVGAMASWNVKAGVGANLPETLSLHAFGDATGKMGRTFYDLGNLYRVFKRKTSNCSVPWLALFYGMDDPVATEDVILSEVEEMERRLKEITQAAKGEKMSAPDAEIVRRELQQTVNILELSAEVGKVRLGQSKPKNLAAQIKKVKDEHKRVWLLRNRPGGLEDSVGKMAV